MMSIGFTMGLAFATAANADPDDALFAQSFVPHLAPLPQEPSSSCDPNYSGPCVPIARDVDCAGGNGPAYVSGPVTVIGVDIYGIDRDGDGTGCE